jgi:hypothetical protein
VTPAKPASGAATVALLVSTIAGLSRRAPDRIIRVKPVDREIGRHQTERNAAAPEISMNFSQWRRQIEACRGPIAIEQRP